MSKKHIEQEKKTIKKMITIYCNNKHNTKEILCKSCLELIEYTERKTENCVYKYNKPACSLCPVHCYSKVYKKKIREVMRFSGPRIIFYSPKSAILHLINVRRTKRNIKNNNLKV